MNLKKKNNYVMEEIVKMRIFFLFVQLIHREMKFSLFIIIMVVMFPKFSCRVLLSLFCSIYFFVFFLLSLSCLFKNGLFNLQ